MSKKTDLHEFDELMFTVSPRKSKVSSYILYHMLMVKLEQKIVWSELHILSIFTKNGKLF